MSTGANSNPTATALTTATNSNPATNPNTQTNVQSQQQPPQHTTTTTTTNSNVFEIESQFILRMPSIKLENGVAKPHPAAQALRDALAEQAKQTDLQEDPLKSRLFIDINPETRKGRVKFDDEVFEARLVDLPCVIESLKTIDKKMFYKTGDICQMLICRSRDDPPWSGDEDEAKAKISNKKGGSMSATSQAEIFLRKYQWPHGITPPLKNVRRKRFRRVAKKKCIDYVEIEREVKQLFRADREAVQVSYEVVFMEGEEPPADDDQDGERKARYDWDDDSMMSQDDNSSSFMRRSNHPKSSRLPATTMSMSAGGGETTQGGLGASGNGNGVSRSKKVHMEDNSVDNMDENSTLIEMGSKKPSASGSGMVGNDEDTMASGDGRGTRSNLDNKNFDDLTNDEDASNLESSTNFKNKFVKEVIGDLSSSEDDDDDDLDDDDQNEDEEKPTQSDDSNSNMESVASKSKSNFNEFEENAETMEGGEDTMDDDEEDDDENSRIFGGGSVTAGDKTKSELNNQLNKLLDELGKIQEERKRREIEIAPINNPVLKAHLSSRLRVLLDEENKKRNEIEEIKSRIE